MHTLTDHDVTKLVTMADVIEAMRQALQFYSAGDTWVPLRARWGFQEPETTMLAMPASSARLGMSVLKVLTLLPGNAAQGLPTIQGEITVFDRLTGRSLARLEAERITQLRTAACSAIATDKLAPQDASVLAVFGSGPQALAHIEAIRLVRPISRVMLFARNVTKAAHVAKQLCDSRVDTVVASSLQELQTADIVCTATNANAPLFQKADVRHGVHINAVGSYRPDMRELSPELVRESYVVVDSVEFCASEAGELRDTFGSASSVMENVVELGRVLSQPHQRKSQNTIYKSVGNAGQDLFTAALVLSRLNR